MKSHARADQGAGLPNSCPPTGVGVDSCRAPAHTASIRSEWPRCERALALIEKTAGADEVFEFERNPMDTVAIVTGGSRGIGRSIVQRLALRGHQIVMPYASDDDAAQEVARLVEMIGGAVHPVRCDVADVSAPQRIADVAESIGELTVLVNNAGITGPIGPLRGASDETLHRVVDVNLMATMRLSREIVTRWESRAPRTDRGIVNLSSIAAKSGASGEYVWYAAAKAAIEAFTVGLAGEVAGQQVRVNAVRAGTTATSLHARAGRPDRAARVGARVPLGRPAAPDDIAAAVDWLCSPDASYVTGAVLTVAGGS